MRYSASEKFEIIELVEQSSLSIRRTLAPIGIPRSTFYDWYSRYREGGIEALVDGKPRPRRTTMEYCLGRWLLAPIQPLLKTCLTMPKREFPG